MENSKIYSIWKPSGITSYDVIRKIKNAYDNLGKIGHCGTLDPFAEGVLLVCTGSKVKESSHYMKLSKTYIADFVFGKETDTLDCTGNVFKEDLKKTALTKELIDKSMNKYIGNHVQSPPYFSAKKINGVRMYELARNDVFIRPKGSTVEIHSLNIISFKDNRLKIKIKCGAGMYVRSLARDIAYDLNTFAFVDCLKRVKIGEFDLKKSIKYNDIGTI